MLLFLPIMSGCVTTKKATPVLPPRPEREELEPVKSIADMAKTITYYEHLIQEWEAWGETAVKIIGEKDGNKKHN